MNLVRQESFDLNPQHDDLVALPILAAERVRFLTHKTVTTPEQELYSRIELANGWNDPEAIEREVLIHFGSNHSRLSAPMRYDHRWMPHIMCNHYVEHMLLRLDELPQVKLPSTIIVDNEGNLQTDWEGWKPVADPRDFDLAALCKTDPSSEGTTHTFKIAHQAMVFGGKIISKQCNHNIFIHDPDCFLAGRWFFLRHDEMGDPSSRRIDIRGELEQFNVSDWITVRGAVLRASSEATPDNPLNFLTPPREFPHISRSL